MPPIPSDESKIPSKIKLYKILGIMFFLVLGFSLGTYIKTSDLSDVMEESNNLDKDSVVVTLTEDGYQPEVTIKKGTTVVFKSELDKPFWPASNLHPSHEIYSDFDPMRPLNSDETWSFLFNRVGVWQMHDHIRSYYTGIINVVE